MLETAMPASQATNVDDMLTGADAEEMKKTRASGRNLHKFGKFNCHQQQDMQ